MKNKAKQGYSTAKKGYSTAKKAADTFNGAETPEQQMYSDNRYREESVLETPEGHY